MRHVSDLQGVLDRLDVGVIVVDGHGEVVSANPAARRLTGRGAANAVADRSVALLVRDVIARRVARTDTLELHGPPRRTLRLRAVPLPSGAVLEITDISEARRLDQVRRDVVANMSHELKTPVGALALLAETLVEERDPGVAARLAERIRDESRRLARIVEDLLDLSRIEAQGGPGSERVDLREVVAEAHARVASSAERNQVSVDAADVEAATVIGDRRQLVSAVFNLLENAITYSDPGGRVGVAVHVVDDDHVEVTVTDQGIGIPEAELDRIFERFYRVDPARSRATGGTGLGLAIVRHIAENHGARITVRSRVSEGSCFTLTFRTAKEGSP